MANRFWMVRAGEGGYLIDTFEREGFVAISWEGAGDFTGVQTLDDARGAIARAYPETPLPAQANAAGVVFKFRQTMRPGDDAVSYDRQRREYLLGKIAGPYRYEPQMDAEYRHRRTATWEGRVSRDALTQSARNTLGSVLALFEPGVSVLGELRAALAPSSKPAPPLPQPIPAEEESAQTIRRDLLDKAHEFIKDRILALSPDEMEMLTAAVLRAMGYKTRVTAKGPDRGRDVLASPDGLGFQSPRIVAEVKHRPRTPADPNMIRGLLGGLRDGDHALFVSTGGFTREAEYEAARSKSPLTLINLDDLASLVTEHYEGFDADGRALVPLTRILWPAA